MNIRLAVTSIFLAFLCGLFLYEPLILTEATPGVLISKIKNTFSRTEPAKILFVGDIMMARGVETLIETEGVGFPFQYVQSELSNPDISIGNFEGIVTEVHKQTESGVLRFSVKEEYLRQLHTAGFDVLSLANNHSYDYGESGLVYTREKCKEYELVCVGSPKFVDEYSVSILPVNGIRIGIIALHTLYGLEMNQSLKNTIRSLSQKSDVQIAYVHWGEEYQLVHNSAQASLAHGLIDNGIDAVIGHHPHVVQDVELYNKKPIFYSLGNFIFDQYFSSDVQEGLGIEMSISKTDIAYTFIPFQSERSQPRIMEKDKAKILFARILQDVSGLTEVNQTKAVITITR